MKRLREFLKRILPPPVRSFMREVKNILKAIGDSKKELKTQIEKLTNETASIKAHLKAQNEELKRLYVLFESVNRDLLEKAHKTLDTKLSEQTNELSVIKQKAEKAMRSASEAVWAEVFNSAIKNCSWLKDVSLSPGRWAVGYPYLYVMFRILNELRPKSILEFGLGQSTRMIAQYAAANKDVKHYVVEHDKNWIEFFGNDCILPENTEIVVLDYDFVSYKEAKKVRIYKGASMVFQNMKFDYISIDGPLGGDMDSYSRIDILNLLPDCLKDSFIIMLDDYNRLAEQNTGREIERILKENGIAFKASTYYGDKDIRIWCSQDLAFYCSL